VSEPRPLALAYHGLGEIPPAQDPYRLSVAPAALRRQIAALHRYGYRLVTFGDLVRRTAEGAGRGLAALTFDDGFADNLALAELGVPATVFVVSGWLGAPHPDAPWARILDPGEIRRLHAAGIEIGAHTVTHPDLTALDPEAARVELEQSRRDLEALVEAPVTSAAYPYGRATAATVRACAEAGFAAACRTKSEGTPDDPLDFPREDMLNGSTQLGLRLKVAGRYEPLMRHRPARALRRLRRMVVER
jgi:peptidoglycan/xylan/chitin deacetylase (PgdA/CDA1 family)